MGLLFEVRVGRKRTIVIPKAVAEALRIDEGSRILIEVQGDHAVIKPLPDAIDLSLHGVKIAKITLEELEAESVERQRDHFDKA